MKNFAGGCAGCLVYMFLVMGLLTAAFAVIGVNASYAQPGAWDVSMTWAILHLGLGFLATVLAGIVCAKIASSVWAPRTLAGIILVFGLLGAGMSTMAPDPGPRPADTQMMDAMSKSKTPMWAMVAGAIFGAAGVLVGASLVKQPQSSVGVDR